MVQAEVRRLVGDIIAWASKNLGIKPKYRTLRYQIRNQNFWRINDTEKFFYGYYNIKSNTIIVYRDNVRNVRDLIKLILHEYTHFLQDMRSYRKMHREHGYWRHPQEIEARAAENKFAECWKEIKHKFK